MDILWYNYYRYYENEDHNNGNSKSVERRFRKVRSIWGYKDKDKDRFQA